MKPVGQCTSENFMAAFVNASFIKIFHIKIVYFIVYNQKTSKNVIKYCVIILL